MGVEKISIKIKGMQSENCVETVMNLIQFERGIQNVQIDLKSGTARVEGDEKMNREQIINSINLSKTYSAS